MGFGDVYTALQAGILDGAENNELALTDNGHGDICKYYSYDMHQMVPDLLVANYEFLSNLSPDERAIFEEGFQLINQVERDAWAAAVEEAKNKAENEQARQLPLPGHGSVPGGHGTPAHLGAGCQPRAAVYL